jgi:ornithine cyclodeaminase/alanine dehydrogenase-like protein (mu-crystallin family)
MLLLSESDVRKVLPMADLIPAMADALAAYSSGGVTQPVRQVLEVGPERAYFGVMPASVESGTRAVGAKLVTVYQSNAGRGLPSHLATIVLLDPETGALEAVMDGRYITEARTAAVSAVSVQRLARPDASTLTILGSGVQAGSHLEAIRHVRSLGEVRVWSPSAERRRAFVDTHRAETGLDVREARSAADAVRGADIVVLVTASRTPVVDDADIAPGTHVVGVGACRPDQREMPTALVARARVFVDSRAGALQEAGDIVLPIGEGAFGATHLAGELGELVAGRVDGRRSRHEITIFKSLGMAVEDVSAAALAARRALAAGMGTTWSPA